MVARSVDYTEDKLLGQGRARSLALALKCVVSTGDAEVHMGAGKCHR